MLLELFYLNLVPCSASSKLRRPLGVLFVLGAILGEFRDTADVKIKH